jgi:hypothetical protein
VRTYDVAAINHDIVYNAKSGEHDPAGAMYVLAADEAAVRAGSKPAEPLFLRANAGDCLQITLTNKLPRAGCRPTPATSRCLRTRPSPRATASRCTPRWWTRTSPALTERPSATTSTRPWLPAEHHRLLVRADDSGGTSATLADFGDRRGHRHHGLFGGLLIEPKGSTWSDPKTASRSRPARPP